MGRRTRAGVQRERAAAASVETESVGGGDGYESGISGRSIFRRDLIFSILTQIVHKIPSLIAAMILTRVFAPEAMGGFFFASALGFFFVLLTVFGTNLHLVRAVASQPAEGLRRLGEVLSLRLPLTLAALVVMNGIMLALMPELWPVVLLTSIYILVGDLSNSFGAFLTGLRRFGLRLLIGLTGPVLLVASVPLAVHAGASLPGVLLCYAGASLLMLVVSGAVVRFRFGHYPLTFDPNVLRRLVLLCWPFVVLDALQIIQFKVDVLMIFGLVSAEAAAHYETAYRLLEVSRLSVRPLAMIVFPLCVAMAVSGDWQGVRRLTGQTLGVGLLVGLGLAGAVALTADTLMATVWGPAYAGSGPLLRVLFLTAPFLFVSVIGAMLANALHLERSLMRVMGTATILNITLNGVAIPLWGALGAAWTTLLTEVFIVTGVVFIVIGTVGARQGSRPQPQLNERNLVGLVSDRPREGT